MDNQSNIYLSRKNLMHNLAHVRKQVQHDDTLCVCVKANAYGHGLEPVARELITLGVDWLAVHTLNEAATLRRVGFKDNILILGPLMEERHWQAAYTLKTRFFIYSQEQLLRYTSSTGLKVDHPIHLKINTGLNRLGFTPEEIPAALSLITKKKINIEGIATHFATADAEPAHPLYTQQLTTWKKAVNEIQKNQPIKFVHAANSSTVLKGLGPTVGVLHRPGMAIYGYSPVPSLRDQLKPVLSWRAPVVHIFSVPAGETVSYGATWRANRPTTVAVLSVGYYDGLDRSLSNIGHVMIKGHCYPIIGRVCMDMTMIDITDCPTKIAVGDEASIIDGENLTAYDLASSIDTIPYEVLARLNPLSINRQLVD